MKVNIREIMKGMQKVYIENGVTTVQDGATNKMALKLLKLSNTLGALKIDVVAYPLMNDGGREVIKDNPKMVRTYKKHLKLGGYKVVLDGSPQGRSAWMSQPYLGGEEDYCGYPWMPDEEVYQYALQAVDDNQQRWHTATEMRPATSF